MAEMNSKIEEPKITTISQQQLNAAVSMMVKNDKKLLPNTGYAPKIWECTWYNSPVGSHNVESYGYSKGDAVWINTEDLDEFTKHNAEHIREVIAGNSKLKTKYEAIAGNEKTELEFMKKVVCGDVVGSSTSQPLYYLGSLLEPVKLKVSVVDNNIDLPTDSSEKWKDFFNNQDPIEFSEKLNTEFERLLSSFMNQHMLEYHLSGMSQYWNDKYGQTRQLEDLYLKKTLDNVSLFQEFGNTPGEDNWGFDYVIHFCKKPFESSDGTKSFKWFRVWRSGYLEHGGIVYNDQKIASAMGDSFECDNRLYRVNLTWAINRTKTAPSFKYSAAPTGFYFEDNKISLSGTQYALDTLGRHVSEQDRYQIQVTPILGNASQVTPYSTMHVDTLTQSVHYMSRDVINLANDSFCFVLDPDIQQYSYYVAGFVSNIQQGYIK